MKKIIIAMVVLVLTLGLISCSDNNFSKESSLSNEITQSSHTEKINTSVTDPTEPEASSDEATESKKDSSESEAEPTESEAEPTESEAEPTESEAEPTESEAEPTESEAEPTESEAVPTESEAEPTESEAEPTESEAEPTESEAEPTESEAEPTESEAEPTESEPEPTESESEPLVSKYPMVPLPLEISVQGCNFTLQDFYTYMLTRSKNPEDYSGQNVPGGAIERVKLPKDAFLRLEELGVTDPVAVNSCDTVCVGLYAPWYSFFIPYEVFENDTTRTLHADISVTYDKEGSGIFGLNDDVYSGVRVDLQKKEGGLIALLSSERWDEPILYTESIEDINVGYLCYENPYGLKWMVRITVDEFLIEIGFWEYDLGDMTSIASILTFFDVDRYQEAVLNLANAVRSNKRTETESESTQPEESTGEATESEVEPTESEIEPTESEVEPTKSEPEPTESEPEPSLGEPEVEYIVYKFHTIKDLHTYATTGSTNLEDYSARPSPSFDIMIPLDIIKFYGYHSIYEYFTFDEAAFDDVSANFSHAEYFKGVEYWYVFDKLVDVEIHTAPSMSLLDCYRRRTGKNITENDLVPYSKDGFGSERRELTVLREFGDFKIIYDVLSGVKTRVHFIVGDCYIVIEGVRGSLYGPLEELYDVFVSNEKVSAFSAFFSDDDETFAAAVERAQKPVEDEAEEAK